MIIDVAKTVVEKNGKYLLVKRVAASKFFPNQWDFPGGKMHADEEPSVSAIRETKEETSLNVMVEKMVLEGEHIENGAQIRYRIFSISDYQGKVKLSKDHSKFAWLSAGQLKRYHITPFVKKYFESI